MISNKNLVTRDVTRKNSAGNLQEFFAKQNIAAKKIL